MENDNNTYLNTGSFNYHNNIVITTCICVWYSCFILACRYSFLDSRYIAGESVGFWRPKHAVLKDQWYQVIHHSSFYCSKIMKINLRYAFYVNTAYTLTHPDNYARVNFILKIVSSSTLLQRYQAPLPIPSPFSATTITPI